MTHQYTPSDASAADSGVKQSEAIGIRMGSALSVRGHIGTKVRALAQQIGDHLTDFIQKEFSDVHERAAALIQVGHQLQVAAINALVCDDTVSLGDMIVAHAAIARAQILLSGVNTAAETVGLEKMNEVQRADLTKALETVVESNFDVRAYSEESNSQCACCDSFETSVDAFLSEKRTAPRIHTGAEAAAMARAAGVDPSVPEGATLGCIEFDEHPTREQVIRTIMQVTGATYAQIDAQIPQDVSEMLHDTVQVQIPRTRTDGPRTVH